MSPILRLPRKSEWKALFFVLFCIFRPKLWVCAELLASCYAVIMNEFAVLNSHFLEPFICSKVLDFM